MKLPVVRTGQAPPQVDDAEFLKRFAAHFEDPYFDAERGAIDRLGTIALKAYREHRKAPRTRKAGAEFADPTYDLAVEWIEARERLRAAEAQRGRVDLPARVLVVLGGGRNDGTCPGENGKTWRLGKIAEAALQAEGCEVDLLDLSRLASDYDRHIHPCKACVSTAMPLCHWPCSCYPNHSLGQVNDAMSDIYEQWVRAHGILLVTPVYWENAPGGLKSMIDRLVCADGGNPDPSSTHGKKPEEAKALELNDWSYPKHLKGRSFGVVVHGDAAGTEGLRKALVDWLLAMELIESGGMASVDRYIGYYEPYATSHEALDRDEAVQEEVRNAARAVARSVALSRAGQRAQPDADLEAPRQK